MIDVTDAELVFLSRNVDIYHFSEPILHCNKFDALSGRPIRNNMLFLHMYKFIVAPNI
jgi:hypothetical protein